MRANGFGRGLLPGAIGLVIGMAIASGRLLQADPPASPQVPSAGDGPPKAVETYFSTVPADRGLDSNLFVQTSAEYRACCYQAFRQASGALDEGIRARKPGDRPPAVVLDLDETVFDNAGFQAMLVRSGLTYDRRLWRDWQRNLAGRLALVPGARDFIRRAKAAGVAVAYVGNTRDEHREGVKAALAGFEIPVEADDLLLLRVEGVPDPDDKTARRASVTSRYDVLVLVGDNLRDFDDAFAFKPAPNLKTPPEDLDAAILARKRAVDDRRDEFGRRFILLPNPVYGEWMKPLNRGEHDEDRLVTPKP